jgi:uncharacterized protein with HEPN domain
MNEAARKRLLDALTACEAIGEFVGSRDFSEYEANALLRSAVERQFEIVGEALGRAAQEDDTLPERLPELRRIVGLRNRLIHGYDSVDDAIVWDIVQHKLPALRVELAILLRGETER